MKRKRTKILLTLPLSYLILNNWSPAQAQIAPDGTLSTNVTTTDNLNFTIEQGNRAGNNLFHSFREFSVPTGGEAFFNNAADIQNIFSRVTGGSISNIDGLIRANGTANLFLLNPSGIIFGPNARLNIGGSFMASTARSLIFADGTQFSTTNTQTAPLLTVNVPVGLQYGSKAEPIRVQGSGQNLGTAGATKGFDSDLNSLQVNPGNTLALVGGNVIIDGGILQAPGGRIEVGGLAGEGTIAINEDGSLTFPSGVQRGDVSIINKAGINVLAGGGGNIAINAQNLEISDSLLTTGIATGLGTPGARAGNISIDATGAINITASRIENNVNPERDEQPAAIGDGGDIIIQAGSTLTTDGASLSTGTFGEGKGGNLIITANTVSLTNGTDVDSITTGLGDAGNIEIISKGDVAILESTLESDIKATLGAGNAGNIFVQANGLVRIFNSEITSAVPENAAGNGGNIIIEAGAISMIQNTPIGLGTVTKGDGKAGNIILTAKDGIDITTSIISSDTFGAGNAGLVEINAGGAIAINKTDINSQVNANSTGNGGMISIDGKSVSLTDNTQVQTSTKNGSGDAGIISINASDTVTITGSKIESSATRGSTGNAGNVSITSDGSIYISGGTLIQSSNFVGGNAGNIDLNAKDSISIVNSNIFSDTFNDPTQTLGGFAGTITIKAGNSFALSLQSKITAESFGGAEESERGSKLGTISIDAGSVLLSNIATLSTNTYGTSDAGSIEINAQSVSLTDDSSIQSSTFSFGEAGNITINAKDTVAIANSTILSNAEKGATGDAGNIAIAARVVTLTDKATLGSSNFVGGNAGSVTVEAIDDISIINSDIFSDTFEQGTSSGGFAGEISIKAGNLFAVNNGQITADSVGSDIENPSEAQSRFGLISIEAKAISLSNQTTLSTGAFGAGAGGDITVRTQRLFITDKSRIAAETASAGNGGDIELEARDLIVLRRNSNISTSAGKDGTNGDGGNITIKTPNLVALENSDIAADAFNGRGGRVSITAQGIFGAQAGTKDTPNSDITAISQVGGPELSGTVELNTPNVDPSSGLIELPQTVVDITGLIDRRCSPESEESTFVSTGRGGLPPNPNEPLNDNPYLVDLVNINPGRQESRGAGEQRSRGAGEQGSKKESSQITEIVEAQGWIINEIGQVVLVANPPTVTPNRSRIIPIECYVR